MNFQPGSSPPPPTVPQRRSQARRGAAEAQHLDRIPLVTMAEQRVATKGRHLGSSRRRQLREGSGETPATNPSQEPPWASETLQRVQDFFREQPKDQAGFVTLSDLQKLQEEDFPCSTEELELIFNGLDAAGTGRISTEEFTAGLRQVLSSHRAREHRRRKTASRRVRLALPSPAPEGGGTQERRHFAALVDQLGLDTSEEEEIWQLWVKLQKDEPQLLGNLEDFLAKMKHCIQEARSKKEALEVTLNKYMAERDKEVQQLCQTLEQQIQQEQQRLEQENMARSHQHGMQLQRALDASEKEVQRLVTEQKELEMRCHSLRSIKEATSTENQQLEESNQVLENHLQHLHQQLQQTHRHLQIARDREVPELPPETPVSPQKSLEKSKKNLSEMQIRLGSQSDKPKAKSTHQVVWEVLPAEMSLLGAPARASSMEEDPFPELLKEEHLSDQSSLLREMNDAIAALSKQLKPQAPALADTAHHPRGDAEPQTGQEAAPTHGTTPKVLQETVPSHVGHKLCEGDLKEGAATAELRAPDGTQAGGCLGAGHCRAQELGTEQGESLEEAQGSLFLQGKGTAGKEMLLKVAEQLQGAPGESMEAGEPAQVEVEEEEWMQAKAQPPREAEEEALSQGETLEAGWGPRESGEAAGEQLAMDELHLAAAPGEHTQPLGVGEEFDLQLGISRKLEIKPGEHLEPEPASQGEAEMGAAHGDGVLPKVTVSPGLGLVTEEDGSVEVHPQGDTLGADVPPAQHGRSSGARAEEGQMEVAQPRKAEPQLQGESGRGDAALGGESVGTEVPLPEAVPPAKGQEGGVGTDVQPLEAQSNNAYVQLLAEVEADLQPLSEASSPEMEEGGRVAPDVQPPEEEEAEFGLKGDMGAAAVHAEGHSPAGTAVRSPGLDGLFPVKVQALEVLEAEDLQTEMQLHGGLGPEAALGGQDCAAVQLGEEAKGGRGGQDEWELAQETETIRQGEGAGAGVQSGEQALILGTLGEQSSDASMQLTAEAEELRSTLGGSMEADVQNQSKAGSRRIEQRGNMVPDVQPLDQVDEPELVEMEAEDAQAEMQLHEGLSPGSPQGGEGGAALQLMEEAEDRGQGQGQGGCELPHESVLDLHGAGLREGAGAGVQSWEQALILDTLEEQSSDANMQVIAEAEEPKPTLGGSMEADVQPLDQAGELESAEVEAEDSQVETLLPGGASSEALQGGESGAAMQLEEEREEGEEGQGELELPQEPVFDLQAARDRQGEGAGTGKQLPKEALILDGLQEQSTDANTQLTAEELKPTLGGSMEADVQNFSEAGSLDTEQGGSTAPDVQPLDQVDEPELVEMEAEDAQVEMQLYGGLSPESPQGGEGGAAIQLEEESEEGEEGQGELELPQEPVFDLQAARDRQGEGAGAGVQPPVEPVILDGLQEQSTDANAQLTAEPEELRLTPGGSMAPDVQPLDQIGEPELVETETEDAQAEMQLHEGLSPGSPQGGEGGAALQLEEKDEAGGQEQGECVLPHEPVPHSHGVTIGQGEGAGAGKQLPEEALILDGLQEQSTDANTQLTAEREELTALGGSTDAALAPLGTAGLWEGEQNPTPGSRAGLCAAPTAGMGEGAAGAPVSPPAKATSHPEHAAVAAEGPGLEAMPGPLAGPVGQILEDTQPLEIPQGEHSAAGERPLDGAQGLQVAGGERHEAGVRSLAETQSLELEQVPDDGVSALASWISEVTSQISTLTLETVMQEDVLVPDVWPLGASGQAAPGELQEQVSAQADKLRPHTASQQLEEKPPRGVETEQVAARPAEPPKQELPPASSLHTGAQQEEDVGNDQPGMVLRDSSLGAAATSNLQLPRQQLGEQSSDLTAGQEEEKQEVGQRMSQAGKPNPGEPGAVTAAGAGAAPRSSPEASLEPEHLYNVLFVGDSHVGKTSFLCQLHAGSFNPHLTATVGLDYQIKNLLVDNKHFALRLWDSAGQERYRSVTKQLFRKADGVVLMYDITSGHSFCHLSYWLSCIQEGAEDGVTILLLGNKSDCPAERQVPTKEGERLAKEHQLLFYECSAASGHNVSESMVTLVRLLKVREDEFKRKVEEVSKAPQKKKGCCW